MKRVNSGLPTIHQAEQNLLNECNRDVSPTERPDPVAQRYLLLQNAVQ